MKTSLNKVNILYYELRSYQWEQRHTDHIVMIDYEQKTESNVVKFLW